MALHERLGRQASQAPCILVCTLGYTFRQPTIFQAFRSVAAVVQFGSCHWRMNLCAIHGRKTTGCLTRIKCVLLLANTIAAEFTYSGGQYSKYDGSKREARELRYCCAGPTESRQEEGVVGRRRRVCTGEGETMPRRWVSGAFLRKSLSLNREF